MHDKENRGDNWRVERRKKESSWRRVKLDNPGAGGEGRGMRMEKGPLLIRRRQWQKEWNNQRTIKVYEKCASGSKWTNG